MRFLRTLLCVFILSYDYGYCQQTQEVECLCYDPTSSESNKELIKESLFGPGLKIDSFQIRGSVCKYSGLKGFELGEFGVLLSTGSPKNALLIEPIQDLCKEDGSSMCVSISGEEVASGGDVYIPKEYYEDPNNPTDKAEIHDAAIIVFDFEFTDGCDGIFFNYVFASEEYPNYVCSVYNDKFAFYIAEKKDGKSENYEYKNIATIPGTDISVEINSVNSGLCGDSANSPNEIMGKYTDLFVKNDPTTAFNGRTIPLSASVRLDPNKVYHAYIIVADFVDSNYDSGVFFKGNGIFGRKCPTISAQCENGVSKYEVETESSSDAIESYQWLKNGQPIENETGNTCTAQDNSTYSVDIKYGSGYFINVIAPKERCCSANGEITINGEVVDGSLSVCKDKVLNIEYSHGNQLTNPQYEWTFTDVSEIDTFTSSNLSITAKKNGNCQVETFV